MFYDSTILMFRLPMYEPRKTKKRYRFKLRELPQARPYLKMKSRTQRKRFNPWVYNSKPYVWKPPHKR